MPRLRPDQSPKYRRHASGQAIVTLPGGSPGERRDKLLGKYGSLESYQAYDAVIAEWRANGRRPGCDVTPLTIKDLVHRFWEYAKTAYVDAGGKPSGECSNFGYALLPLLELYGAMPAAEFSPLALRAVRDRMITMGWCRNVINRQVNRIRQTFKWAVSHELIPSSIHHGLQAVEGLRRGRGARESAPVKPAADHLIAGILPVLSPMLQAMVELHLLTGMRSTELCTMRVGDIDTASDKSGKLWFYRPQTHKTAHHGHERVVYLGKRAREIIQPFLKSDLQAYLFSPAEAEQQRRARLTARRKTPLSCGNRPGSNVKHRPQHVPGACYDKNSYAQAIARACRKAFPLPAELLKPEKMPDRPTAAQLAAESQREAKAVAWIKEHHVHPHQFRHNAATRMRHAHGFEAAQVMLGDRTPGMVQRYAEQNVAMAIRIVGEVG